MNCSYCTSARLKQFIAAFAATLGIFALGNVLAWTSPAFPDMESSHEFKNGILTDDVKSWIGSICVLGALTSSPFAGYAADKLGRRKTMIIIAVPFTIGWLIVGFAGTTIWMILTGRFITGFCGGVFSLSAPIYIAEISEDAIRGTMSLLFQLMLVIGILFTYGVGSFISWSLLAFISALIPAFALIFLAFVPESPRYLMIQGRKDEASESLEWLRNAGAGSTQQIVHIELVKLEDSLEETNSKPDLKLEDIFSAQIIKPILIVLSLVIFEQISGYNGVIFYIGSIFKASGSNLSSALCSIIVGIIQVAATIVSAIYVDSAGRRILLLLGQVFMTIPLVILGFYFYVKEAYANDKEVVKIFELLGWIPVVCLVIFISAFSLGIGPLSWTLIGELLAPNIKGVCSAIAVCLVWTSAFIVTKTFTDISNTLGIAWCFWIYAICCVIGFISIYLTVPETKGKSLEEIQQIFAK